MAKTIEQILGWVNLTGVIQEIKSGIPDVLPPAFKTVKTETIADSGRYTQVRGVRTTAKRAEYGAPAVRRELIGVSSKDVKLIHLFEEMAISPLLYQALRNYDNYQTQQRGMTELARQMGEFKRRFENTRIASVVSMLFKGAIYYDTNGNLLPTSSGATLTVDYQVPANNIGSLNSIIAAPWSTASTDISSHIRTLKTQSLKDSGYELTHCFYGKNIPSYLAKNDYLKDWWVRHPQMREKWTETGEIPDGLFGIKKWIPAYESFFEDNDGTNQTFVDADAITFTPDITNEVYELMEGTYMVPTTFNPLSSITAAMGSFSTVTGQFGYAVPWHNPPSALAYMGDTFLPIWKNPNAIYLGDATP